MLVIYSDLASACQNTKVREAAKFKWCHDFSNY